MIGFSQTSTVSNWFLFLLVFQLSCQPAFLDEEVKTSRKCGEEQGLLEKAQTYFKPIEASQPVGFDSALVALGEELFRSVLLSQNKTQSCNSCHPLENYGMDGKRLSQGALGDEALRNTPTVYNAVFNLAQFWDGRAADLEEQALQPIFNRREMAMRDSSVLLERLRAEEKITRLFERAFPENDQPLSLSHLAKALAAFQKTLVTPTRFDAYLLGDETALTKKEKEGLGYFLDLGCSPCHSGVGVGGSMYQPFGVVGYYWDYTGSESRDEGRYAITGNEGERYWFKVPSLRNISKTAPYFHDGSVSDLGQAVQAMASAQLNRPLESGELEALLAFLKAL